MNNKLWCLGFIFSNSLRHVVLIKKSRTMHIGLWNGVGGSIEEGEGFRDAMSRETKEEAELKISPSKWIRVGDLMGGDEWTVALFTYHDADHKLTRSLPILNTSVETDQWASDMVAYVPIFNLPFLKSAPHTNTLIFASLEKHKNPNSPHIVIQF